MGSFCLAQAWIGSPEPRWVASAVRCVLGWDQEVFGVHVARVVAADALKQVEKGRLLGRREQH